VQESPRGFREWTPGSNGTPSSLGSFATEAGDHLDRAQGALEAAGIEVRTSVVVAGLPPAIDDLLARVVREAVANIVRHSQAQRAEISLTAAGGVVHLEVSNDGAAPGAGDPTSGEPGGGGLSGMRERVAAAGGRLTAAIRDGGVFRITAVVPLDAPAPRRERDRDREAAR